MTSYLQLISRPGLSVVLHQPSSSYPPHQQFESMASLSGSSASPVLQSPTTVLTRDLSSTATPVPPLATTPSSSASSPAAPTTTANESEPAVSDRWSRNVIIALASALGGTACFALFVVWFRARWQRRSPKGDSARMEGVVETRCCNSLTTVAADDVNTLNDVEIASRFVHDTNSAAGHLKSTRAPRDERHPYRPISKSVEDTASAQCNTSTQSAASITDIPGTELAAEGKLQARTSVSSAGYSSGDAAVVDPPKAAEEDLQHSEHANDTSENTPDLSEASSMCRPSSASTYFGLSRSDLGEIEEPEAPPPYQSGRASPI